MMYRIVPGEFLEFEDFAGPQTFLDIAFEGATDEDDLIRLKIGDPGAFGIRWDLHPTADNTNTLAMTRRWGKLMALLTTMQDKMPAEQMEITLRVFHFFHAQSKKDFLMLWDRGRGVWR